MVLDVPRAGGQKVRTISAFLPFTKAVVSRIATRSRKAGRTGMIQREATATASCTSRVTDGGVSTNAKPSPFPRNAANLLVSEPETQAGSSAVRFFQKA